ncbi:FG-GAP-like repeat-containing protein [Calditrichota bacterium]
MDLLGADQNLHEITWWENNGEQEFEEHVIGDEFRGASGVYAIDMDLDNDLDILGAARLDDEVIWWENDGNEDFTEHVVTDSFNVASSVFAIDLDSDGDIDILGAATLEENFTWWENDGDQEFTEHNIDGEYENPYSIYAIDIDSDDDVDVLLGADDYVVWWENDGEQEFTANELANDLGMAATVYAIDFDEDDDVDIIGGGSQENEIRWWENDGDQDFDEHLIDGNIGVTSVFPVDMDRDNDNDILASSGDESGLLNWYENTMINRPSQFRLLIPENESAIDTSGIQLTWELSNDADSGQTPQYEVWIASSPAFDNPEMIAEDIEDTVYIINDLQNSTWYYWTVFATDENTIGRWADDTLSFYVEFDTPRPENFSLVYPGNDSTITQNFINLSWEEAVEPEEGDSIIYYVLWWASNGGFTENLDSVRVTGLEYLLPNLDDDQSYWWKVRAKDTNSRGTWSDETWSFNIEIPQKPRGPEIVFDERIISDQIDGPIRIKSIDMDYDGDLDIVTHSSTEILWFESENAEHFTSHFIGNSSTAFALDCGDIDFDGDIDVASKGNDGVTLYLNNGDLEFDTMHITDDHGFTSVQIVDLDDDGNRDIIRSQNSNLNSVLWARNDGELNFTIRTLSPYNLRYPLVKSNDLDRDGDLDILVADNSELALSYLRNDGNENFTPSILAQIGTPDDFYPLDIDQDGDTDILAVASSQVIFLENVGNLEFTINRIDTAFANAWSVCAGDLDEDGDYDIIASAFSDDAVSWWENDGQQDFTEHNLSSEFDGAYTVITCDLDKDGDLDVVGTARIGDAIAWWEQEQNFSLLEPDSGARVWDETALLTWQACTDPDPDDPILYKIFWATDEELSESLDSASTADTTFELTDLQDTTTYWWTIRAQDTNTEGLWAADTFSFTRGHDVSPDNFALLSPENGSTFSREFIVLSWEESTEPEEGDSVIYYVLWWATNSDFTENLDSVRVKSEIYHLDNLEDDQTYWWKVRAQDTNSRGTWSEEQWSFEVDIHEPPRGHRTVFSESTLDVVGSPYSLIAIDFDIDGDIDIVSERHTGDEIIWLENEGDHVFTDHEIGPHDGPRDVDVADIDGDGDMDVIAGGDDDGRVILYVNNGDQEFDTLHVLTAGGGSFYKVKAVDMDYDGDLDIVRSYSSHTQSIPWARNNGNLNFSGTGIPVDRGNGLAMEVVDIDGDLDIDVIGNINQLGIESIILYENDGQQNYESAVLIEEDVEYTKDLFSIDIDGDGDIDFLVADSRVDEIRWFENDGDLVFTSHLIIENFNHPGSVFAADFDDDGDVDLLATEHLADEVIWWENDGAENFTEHLLTDNLDGAEGVFARDVDGDGDIELLCAGTTANTIKMWIQEHHFYLSQPADASIIGDTLVSFAWNVCTDPDPDDEIVYSVFWATDSELTENRDSSETADTTFELTDLNDPETYYWTVHAQDLNTEGSWSEDTLSFIIQTNAPLGEFSLLSPDSGIVLDQDTVTVFWSSSVDPESELVNYSIQWSTDAGFSEYNSGVTADTFFSITGLEDILSGGSQEDGGVRQLIMIDPGERMVSPRIKTGIRGEYEIKTRGATQIELAPHEPASISSSASVKLKQQGISQNESPSSSKISKLSGIKTNAQLQQTKDRRSRKKSSQNQGTLAKENSSGVQAIRSKENRLADSELDELPDDATIYWRVRASDELGFETWSDQGEAGWSFNIYVPDRPDVFNLVNPFNRDTVWTPDTTLTWEAARDLDPDDSPTYNVWLSLMEDMQDAMLIAEGIAENQMEIFGLTDDSDYFWTVQAIDNNTEGRWAADTLSFHTYFPEPPQAFNLTRPVESDTVWSGNTTYIWDVSLDPDPDDAITYTVFWATDENFTENLDSAVTTRTYIEVENTIDNYEYWCTVRARDLYMNETWSSNVASFYVYIPDSPGVFNLDSPEDRAQIGEDTVLVSWSRSLDADPGDTVTYMVEWAIGEYFALSQTAVTGDTSYLISDFDLASLTMDTPGDRTSKKQPDNTGDSRFRNDMKPTGGLTDNVQEKSIVTYSKPLQTFQTEFNRQQESISESGGDNTERSGELDELPDDIIIYWRVKAIDRFNLQTWANPGEFGRSFGTYYPDPPLAFNLVAPDDGYVTRRDFVKLYWEQTYDPDPGDSLEYEVWLSTSPNFDENLDIAVAPATNIEVADLTDDWQYWWKVNALDTNSPGTWSDNVLSFSVFIPEILAGFSLIQPANGYVFESGETEFIWSNSIDPDPGDSVSYWIYFSNSNRMESYFIGSDTFIALNPDTVEILDNVLETTWFVLAHSNYPDTSIESNSRYSLFLTDRKDENEIPEHYILFPNHPNPFNNSTIIRFGLPEDTGVNIKVYDLEGRLVNELVNSKRHAGYHVVSWDAGTKASGIYLVRMETDNYIKTQKMILVK